MARKQTEIRTESFVRVGEALVRFDDLTEEQKREAATRLKITYLNELFRGKAVFEAAEKAASPDQSNK